MATNKEVEVFGVTYDRYVLLQLHRLLTTTFALKNVVEMPSHGAKAAGSLYSIGFGLSGCQVTLVNPEMEMLEGWARLGIGDKVIAKSEEDVYATSFADDSFDIAWNFVTWTALSDPECYLREMRRISRRYVMLITCNNLQPGYPWHRLLHAWYGFPWTHGKNKYNYIHQVLRLMRRSGMKVAEYGAIDTPGWPDPSGPRDVRLHRRYGSAGHNLYETKPEWSVPLLDYVASGNYPSWMKALGKWDMTFRKGIFKLPLSHLFYVIGKKRV
jgi:SAM-dependent methyltransferase